MLAVNRGFSSSYLNVRKPLYKVLFLARGMLHGFSHLTSFDWRYLAIDCQRCWKLGCYLAPQSIDPDQHWRFPERIDTYSSFWLVHEVPQVSAFFSPSPVLISSGSPKTMWRCGEMNMHKSLLFGKTKGIGVLTHSHKWRNKSEPRPRLPEVFIRCSEMLRTTQPRKYPRVIKRGNGKYPI